MKKKYTTRILFAFLGLFFFGGILMITALQTNTPASYFPSFFTAEITKPVFNGTGTDGGLKALEGVLPGTGVIREQSIIKVVLSWVRLGLTLLGTVAFIAFLWSGALYITAFTNEENAENAKKVMIWTAIGIIIILMSYALTSLFITATS